MARVRIDYGIDLGTTNSAIARIENGEAKIIKSDFQKDTMPSCIGFRKNIILYGDPAYSRISDEHLSAFSDFSKTGKTDHEFNTFIEFKRTMGSDTLYQSKSAGRSFNSDKLSAEVLKALKSFVRDDEISAAVITVPARFRNNQVDATQAAAELAGFEYCELLQEPIAASIAYGVKAQSIDGYWLVFDFGGGTFDVALMKVEDGIMKVVDTGGDPRLGGKDVDYAVVDKIIIPYLEEHYSIENILSSKQGKSRLREALKFIAEEAKIAISPPSKSSTDIIPDKPLGEDSEGKDIELEIKVGLSDFEMAVAPIFQRAINITVKLLKENNLSAHDLEMVILAGGPTLSQTLRRMLAEQLDTKIDTSIDPMTAIAVGAAMFAASKDIPINLQRRDYQKIQLILRYPANSVETEEDLGIKLDFHNTEGEIPERIFVEINRNDKGWSSGRVEIEAGAEIISLPLEDGKSNGFELSLFDEGGGRLPCEPAHLSINQGLKPPDATLPMDLCIAAFSGDSLVPLLGGLDGLLQNQSLPAKGKAMYRTQKDIRPGNTQDVIRIPILEGKRGTREIHNFKAGIVKISGDDLPKFLPKGSEVEITLEVDASRRIMFRAFFPDIDETVERKLERVDQGYFGSDELEREIQNSARILSKLEEESISIDLKEADNLKSEFQELTEMLENSGSDPDATGKVKERLRDALMELDRMAGEDQIPRAEEEFFTALEYLKARNDQFGDGQTTKQVERLEKLGNDALRSENLRAIKELTDQANSLAFELSDTGFGVAFEIGFVQYYDDAFDTIDWTKPNQARKLVNDAKEIALSTDPTKEKLRPLVQQIVSLLPPVEREKLSESDYEYLMKSH